MSYPPGLLDDYSRTRDFKTLQSYLPDGYAYGVFTSDLPVLHAYLLDAGVTEVTEQLAASGVVSLVDRFRMLILQQFLRTTASLPGEVWELGVYRGGTAALIRNVLAGWGVAGIQTPRFRLFDTFAGMPPGDPTQDLHQVGEFADVTLDTVQQVVGHDQFLEFRPGLVPDTFSGLDSVSIRFAHIDLDLHAPTLAALAFIYPRIVTGGIAVFDDYGFATCPGARTAIDGYCGLHNIPLVVLPTGQAVLIKREQVVSK